MDRVRALTAAKMAALEGSLTTGAALSGSDLILTKQDGSTINTGNVQGATGPSGAGVVDFFCATSTTAHYTLSGQWWPMWDWTFSEGNSSLVDMLRRENEQNVPGSDYSSYFTDFWIKYPGLYLIDFSFSFAAGGGTQAMPASKRRIAAIHRNGTEIRRAMVTSTTDYSTTEVSFPYTFVVGDKLTPMMYQDAGDAYNTSTSPGHRITITRLS